MIRTDTRFTVGPLDDPAVPGTGGTLGAVAVRTCPRSRRVLGSGPRDRDGRSGRGRRRRPACVGAGIAGDRHAVLAGQGDRDVPGHGDAVHAPRQVVVVVHRVVLGG